MSGFGFKKVDVADPPLGQAWNQYRNTSAPVTRSKALVKTGGGGSGSTGEQEGGTGGGGGQEPLGCPKCMPWWLIPLAALGVAQAAAWILARK